MAAGKGFQRVKAVQDLNTPEMIEQITQLAAIQLSDPKIAAICGVSLSSYQLFLKKNPDVCQSVDAARAGGIAHAATKLYKAVAEGDHNSIKYTLMTKGGDDWNPVARVKFEGSETLQKLVNMTPRQKLEFLREQVKLLEEIIEGEDEDASQDQIPENL